MLHKGGHLNIIQYLITELGCDPTTPSNNGALPLHIACHNGHLNVAKYFITEQKCDPNSRDQDGWTPLFIMLLKIWSHEHHPIPNLRTRL